MFIIYHTNLDNVLRTLVYTSSSKAKRLKFHFQMCADAEIVATRIVVYK